MKDTMTIIAGAVAFLLFIFAMMFAVRMFSNATTPLVLHAPKPGVTCATMVTSDGAAISCWKD